MSQVALVTGGSSGIGRSTALALKQSGCTVYEMSRREKGCDDITHLIGDVTKEEQVKAAVDRIVQEQGRLDIVINAAGFGISGAIAFTDNEEAKRQFEVNFFGMVIVNRAVLPVFHKQGSGRIVNISSVAGPIAIPFQAYYSACKAAINAYTMALANEVRPYGITVCAVLPGDIATGFTAARQKSVAGDDVYGGRISRSVAVMEHDEQNGMRPEKAGRFIAKVARKKSKKPLYTIGFSYRLFVFLSKILPAQFLNYLVGLIYAK